MWSDSVTLIADGDGTAVLNYMFSFDGFYLLNRGGGHLDTNTYINGTYIPVDFTDNVYRTKATGTVEFTLGKPLDVTAFVDINRGFFTYDFSVFARPTIWFLLHCGYTLPSSVPEPATILSFGCGMLALFAMSIRQRKAELRAFAGLGLDPDAAIMPFDDALADREAHSGTRQFAAVQALEDPENAIVVLRIDTDAVVSHADRPLVVPTSRALICDPRRLVCLVLDRVPDQVLEDLRQLDLVSVRQSAALRACTSA